MGIIGSILFTLFLGDFLWWWRADRVLRRLPQARAGRIGLGVFMAAQAAGLLLVLLDRSLDLNFSLPSAWLAVVYLWHCLFLFPMLLLWIPYALARGIVAGVRRLIDLRVEGKGSDPRSETGSMSRREFARLLGTAVPAWATLGTAIVAYWQLQQFRIRRLEVTLSQLPPALDGLTIAHVTDVHVGQFTRGDVLDRIVAATNDLQADLVLYTGDLINFALSDLDAALAVATRLQGRHGVFLCEGNHDLFENAAEFRRRTRAAGLRLLVNESVTVSIRGVPVQFLGLRWGARDTHPHDPSSRGDQAIARSMEELLPQRQADAFPILLAHHPHAFDFAKDIPLTLAGHTHGGQLMVTPNIGFGPMLYRYWSGLYRKEDCALVVSNGTGNWFPLRTRAPAEIVHITLRRG
jgi:predicted MPP superfamily phosphohydrolase